MDKSVPAEPIEPFDDETESFIEQITPTFDSLKPPEKPITKEKLKFFIIEIEPIIKGVNFLKHEEKEVLGRWLLEIQKEFKNRRIALKIKKRFKEFTDQYEAYLAYPSPFDHNTLLTKLAELEKSLN